MKSMLKTPEKTVLWTMIYASLLAVVVYLYRIWQLGDVVFSYLPWNLFLAWIPLALSLLLIRMLRRQPWSDWSSIALTLVWMLFLPNAFYMLTDYIHLQDLTGANILYDVVMFTMFIFLGMVLGFSSLYVFHKELLRHVAPKIAWVWVMTVLALCSFAIFIGRDLRWNSWDVLASPTGLLFDLSDRIINPSAYGNVYGAFVALFGLLAVMYVVGWRLVALTARIDRELR